MQKNTKKSSIKNKLMRAFLLVCVVALLVSTAVTVVMLFNMRDMIAHSGEDVGEAAGDMSAESLTALALSETSEMVSAKAQIMNGYLGQAIENLIPVKSYMEALYRAPGHYKPFFVPNYKDVAENKLSMHWLLQTGSRPDPQYNESDLVRLGLLDEAYLLGNVEPLFDALMKRREDVSTLVIQTKTGINIQYDTQAFLKAGIPELPDLRSREWFVCPRDTGDLYISDTYSDSIGRGLCVTISLPVYDENGAFAAALGFDFLINDLYEAVREMVVSENGYAMLLGADKVIAAAGLQEGDEYNLPPFWDDVAGDENGITESTVDGENVYVIWETMPLTGWKLACVLPVSDVVAPAEYAKTEIMSMTLSMVSDADKRIVTSILLLLAILAAVLAGVILSSRTVAQKISEPILTLSKGAERISGGDLEHELSVKTGDEIEEMAETFNRMVRDIKHITGEKERIGAELNVATRIQASMLPCIFPAFPEHAEFDIYASMQPAKEVGGDFYDFFLVDENTLAVVMADVSGKGVPAALFMVIAKTLIKNNAQYGESPKDVFEKVNNLLCENNEAGMFVTAFMGYLNISNGKFSFVNAGHNPPLIRKNGSFDWLKATAGFVLAGMEDMFYKQGEITLQAGDELFLYTDGVTEAVNHQDELFSDPRLLETVNHYPDLPLKEFTVSVKREIDKFAEGAEQADDITMLALRYKGSKGDNHIAIP